MTIASFALVVALEAVGPALHVMPSEAGGDWPAQPSGKQVTVDAKTPDEALKQIAAAAGWGLALNSGPSGKVEMQFSFVKVPVEEAFAAVLSASNLHATRIGASVAVTPGDRGSADGADRAEQSGEDSDQSDAAGSSLDAGAAGLLPQLRSLHFSKDRHHRHRLGGNDHVQVGQDIDLPAGAQAGDVVAVGGSVHVGAGATVDDLVAIGGSIETAPGVQVKGDAVAVGGSQHLGAGTSVAGDTVTIGGQLQLEPGASVGGQQINLSLGRLFAFGIPALLIGGTPILLLMSRFAQFVLFFCLGALLLMAVPRQLGNIEASLLRQPLRSGLAGFLGTLAIPVLTLLLVVTLIGIPLVAVEFVGVAVAALMGFTAMSLLIGRQLHVPVRGGGLLGLAVGTAILVALTALPWVGFLVLIAGWFVALGATLVTRFGSE